MNGAESLLRTLVRCGVEICFTNPGTTEIDLVAAAERVDGLRFVLGLFEGVCTGAADGWARMTGRPASTLLHLGPGLANGLANLHNARRAASPVVNLVGDHTLAHLPHDAPLCSDIAGLAAPMSPWVRTASSAAGLAADTAAAVAAALGPPGQVATLIVPADAAWDEAPEPAAPLAVGAHQVQPLRAPRPAAVDAAARALASGEPAALLLGGSALGEDALVDAGRVGQRSGARLLGETFAACLARGAGRTPVARLPYFPEGVLEALAGLRHLVLVGARSPVAFFAYRGQPSELVPAGCEVHVLARPEEDAARALAHLAAAVDAPADAGERQPRIRPEPPSGPLDAAAIAASLAALLPAGAIVSDESNTAGLALFPQTAGAEPHDWLSLTGGSIGQGLPVATGAALACPGRQVIALQADGSALYTVQALWTQAREALDVTTVLFNNRAYKILQLELQRAGVEHPGRRALDLLDLGRPDLDWVRIAEGLGVPATRATSAEGFHRQLAAALAEPGPRLIEALI